MIVIRVPYRISIIGGGLDRPEVYLDWPQMCIGFAINKYSYICLNTPYNGYKYRVAYYELEKTNDIADIKQPAVRAALEHAKWTDPIDISHISDLPARCGLGTSAAFMVGLCHGLDILRDIEPTKRDLAKTAIEIENKISTTGEQDAYFSAFGGTRSLLFHIASIGVFKRDLSNIIPNLMLLYLGGKTKDVASSYVFSDPYKMFTLAKEASNSISSNDQKLLRQLINDSWQQKKTLSPLVTTPEVDGIIDELVRMGCGAKLCGAGNNGCILILADQHLHASIRDKFNYKFIDIGVDYEGSTLVYQS